MTRVALLVEDDKTFLLPAVERAVGKLSEDGFRVTHLGILPPKLGRLRGSRIGLWYLQVLGLRNTALLGLFSVLETARRLRAHFSFQQTSLSWDGLAAKSQICEWRFFKNPNDADALAFLRASECDILIVMVPYILGPEVLRLPKLGAINKHAAILPGCRGLFPHLWSTVLGKPLGVTFHKVVAEIDAGPVLLRHLIPAGQRPQSMVEFYVQVYREFPDQVVEAARRLLKGIEEPLANISAADYFGLPTRADYLRFRQAGGCIVRFGDLWRSLSSRARTGDTGEPAAEHSTRHAR